MSKRGGFPGGGMPGNMQNLMKQMFALDNPYNCPHGRPTFIRITETELEKKFKRIV